MKTQRYGYAVLGDERGECESRSGEFKGFAV